MFAIMFWVIGEYGFSLAISLGKLTAVILSAFSLQYILFGLILLIIGLNPIKFYKKTFNVQSLAFATSSSKATIMTAIQDLQEKTGVSKIAPTFASASARSSRTEIPPIVTSPESGLTIPNMIPSAVLLPAPLCPSKPKTSPRFTVKLTSSKAGFPPPKVLCKFLISSISGKLRNRNQSQKIQHLQARHNILRDSASQSAERPFRQEISCQFVPFVKNSY